MPSPYRVAIAGCHRMLALTPAGHNWAAAFAAVPQTEIVAVFDLGRETRNAFVACWGEMPAYGDYDRMLAEVQPDIVCIATRQTLHAEQVEAAVQAGVRGILSDKPLATSLAEADRIVSACSRARVPLAFGLDRRWYSSYRHLRQLVADGAVGTVTEVLAYGSPNLINHGCHWYDTALMLVGDPEPLWVSGSVADVSGDAADSRRRLDPPGRATVDLANGVVATFTPAGGPGVVFEVLGDKGRLLVLNDAREVCLWLPGGAGLETVSMPDAPAEPWPAGPAAVRDLVAAMASGEPTACDTAQARRATEIGFAVHLSHAQGGARIALPAAERNQTIPSYPWGNDQPS